MAATSSSAKPFPQLKLLAGIFAALALVLALWYFLALRQDYSVLYEGLEAPEASAIVAELERQDIRYKLEERGSRILVPERQADSVRLSIAGSDLPIRGLDGFELFNDSDMGLTDFAQKIRYQRALQGEIARTIMMMDGVEEARVHISMPERALFRGERNPPKAAVTLITRTPEAAGPNRVAGIQRLVAASVPDLSTADVVVLNERGELISRDVVAAPEPLAAPPTSLTAQARELVRRLLPAENVELVIEASTPSASEAGAEATNAPAPLLVRITTQSPLSAQDQERVKSGLQHAGVIDAPSAQATVFSVSAPARVDPAPAPAAPRPAAQVVPEEPASDDLPIWMIAGAVGGVGGLLLLIVGFAARRPMLSLEEQERFVARLKLALSIGDAEARGEAV